MGCIHMIMLRTDLSAYIGSLVSCPLTAF